MARGGDYLKSPDLLQVTHKKRIVGTFGFAVIWIGMAIVLAAFAIGGSGIISLSLPMVILATLIGSVLIGILMT